MPLSQPIFINEFSKGAEENANIGLGTLLGVETYSKKGVAQLTKDTTKVSGSVVTDLPIYFTSLTESIIFAQGDSGKVYKSTDTGTTWTDITNAGSSGVGKGLIFYNGYLFEFRGGSIYYNSTPYNAGTWSGAWQTGLTGIQNFPFIFPNDNSIYFANGFKVGKIGFGTAPTFNPGGGAGTDYFYTASAGNPNGLLPNIYEVKCISYLPTNYLALGVGSSGISNSSQVAAIILWNPTLSTYETPLSLFSQAGAGSAGVTQIINRNNVLYAVTGGNHAIFSTNGTSFTLVEDVSLMTTGRFIVGGNTNGIQSTAPIFINQYPSAIAVLGNKLLTGVSTSISSLPAGYGNYPLGVWSVAFNEDGLATQCEFPISTGTVCGTDFSLGAIYPISQAQMLIGWKDNSAYGIDKTDFTTFQTDINVVQIESEMMEIGTPLEPETITTIQINLVRSLIAGQSISVYYRTAFDQPYTLLQTFTLTDGNIQLNNSLKITKNPIGATKFLQLKISMATGAPNQAWTPEIRNVIITP